MRPLRLGHVDGHDLGVVPERPTEAEPEVERHADHERDVGLGEGLAARAREEQLVVGGHAAARQPVEEHGHAERRAPSSSSASSPCPQYRFVPAMITGRSASAQQRAGALDRRSVGERLGVAQQMTAGERVVLARRRRPPP